MPRAIQRASANFTEGFELGRSGIHNIVNYVQKKLVPYQGLKCLLDAYYSSIMEGSEPPIAQGLAIAVAKAEDLVLDKAEKLHLEVSDRSSAQSGITQPGRVLVTGATGHLGPCVVRQLVKAGHYVRALVRGLSRTTELEDLGVELMYGDVRDLGSIMRAARDIDVIIHMAAGVRGSTGFILDSCIGGTRNVAEAARAAAVRRVIYMSSMAIYDYSVLRDGDEITERSPLDPYPETRSAYALGKRRAEDFALAEIQQDAPAWTILRPSFIVGDGIDRWSAVGAKIGNLVICFGLPGRRIRLVHGERVASAVLGLLQNDKTKGKIFALSEEPVTLREFVSQSINDRKRPKIVYMPYSAAWAMTQGLRFWRFVTGKGPNVNIRRLHYVYRDVSVNTSAIREAIGWEARDNFLDQPDDRDWPAKSNKSVWGTPASEVESKCGQEASA